MINDELFLIPARLGNEHALFDWLLYNFNTFLHPLLVAATSLQTENTPFCKENVLIVVGDLCIFLSDYSTGKPEMSPTSRPKFNESSYLFTSAPRNRD